MITVETKILQPKNFCFGRCMGVLDRGYEELLYTLNDRTITRCIRLASGLAIIQVSSNDNDLIIKITKDVIEREDEVACRDYVTDWFDINRDISGFYNQLKQCKQTQHFVDQLYGLRLMGIVDLFEALCWCVIGQQINLTFAHTIKARLVQKYGDFIELNGEKYHCFPEPYVVINICEDELKHMQFSRQKIQYLYNIAKAFEDQGLNKESLLNRSASDQMKQLLLIKGIGPWTANYVSMKSLRNMRCIAYGDTGLSTALHKYFDTEKKPNYQTIDALFEPFAGWEAYFNFYLWSSLA